MKMKIEKEIGKRKGKKQEAFGAAKKLMVKKC